MALRHNVAPFRRLKKHTDFSVFQSLNHILDRASPLALQLGRVTSFGLVFDRLQRPAAVVFGHTVNSAELACAGTAAAKDALGWFLASCEGAAGCLGWHNRSYVGCSLAGYDGLEI